MLKVTGIPTTEDVAGVTPPIERLEKGPCAVIECYQKIPCNPCATSCPFGAIVRDNDINELPVIDWEICTGCAICVVNCPGLAIFTVDLSKPGKAMIKLPYEYLPLPQVGEIVDAVDRGGEVVGEAKVTKVQEGKAFDRTRLVWLEVPREQAMIVRHFRQKE